MTKTLIELSKLALAKFRGISGEPVTGRLCPPIDLKGEMEALRDLRFGSVWKSSSGVDVCDYCLGDARYLALALALPPEELADLESASEGSIESLTVVGSIYLFLEHKLNRPPREADPLRIEEYIAGPASTEDGVALDVVKGFLAELTVFRVHNDSVFRGEIIKLDYIANYICTFDARFTRHTRLSSASICIIREIFLQERYHLIERNLFEAMSLPSVRHAFLEVYRTLEFTFALPRARSLLNVLQNAGGKIDLNILDFARLCYRQLGWKRVESDAIEKIFREFFAASRVAYESLLIQCSPFKKLGPVPEMGASAKDKANFVNKVAERYYRLRNQIAHQLWTDDEINCADEDWSILIEFSLSCIKFVYEQHLTAPVVAAEQRTDVSDA